MSQTTLQVLAAFFVGLLLGFITRGTPMDAATIYGFGAITFMLGFVAIFAGSETIKSIFGAYGILVFAIFVGILFGTGRMGAIFTWAGSHIS